MDLEKGLAEQAPIPSRKSLKDVKNNHCDCGNTGDLQCLMN
jgi:hypothetical protein